ncbi:putative sigma-54 modulation protein [Desulfitispora alkaliphila]|uniref:ribosome hibernation-promoting factor, HPF/YfiA family n=1 Tax=Desulfitispora alkaliphila TaxID=622674 RepID=UPI003D1D463F
MNIIIRGKNIELTPAIKDHVEKRIGKLDKYFENVSEAQVTLSVEKDRHRVEVTIPLEGIILRGEEETADMYASVDMVVDKLEKQISKHKTKLAKKIKQKSLLDLVPNGNGEIEKVVEADEPSVVRTKKFAIKPMPVEEAILQMNMLGHNFFVFSNAETGQANVLYIRKDGNYGLIEPE